MKNEILEEVMIKEMNTKEEQVEVCSVLEETELDKGYLEELNSKLDLSQALLETLSRQFAERLAYDEKQEKIIDRLHAELQKYRNDMYSTLIRPIFVDIIEVVDNIRKTSLSYAEKGEKEKEAAQIITDYIMDLHAILGNNNVEIYKGTPGDTYTPIKQRIVSCEVTRESELNGKIAESIGFGYMFKGKVIWPEKVKIYKYQMQTF